MRWIKNSAGQQDAMLTFAIGGFIVTIISIFASFIDDITVGDWSITVGKADAAMVSAFLGATLLAYVRRRDQKDKNAHELEKIAIQSEHPEMLQYYMQRNDTRDPRDLSYQGRYDDRYDDRYYDRPRYYDDRPRYRPPTTEQHEQDPLEIPKDLEPENEDNI
jgi:hypothetical protein